MCLALPGKVLTIRQESSLPMGEVDFSGVTKTVCLAFTPEVMIGEYVIVHVGFSISIVDAKRAEETLDMVNEGFHEIY